MIGWQAERFARTMRLQDITEYLKPPLSDQQKRDEGARKVLAMFKRHAAKTA